MNYSTVLDKNKGLIEEKTLNFTMESCLEELFGKRLLMRENALSAIVEAFTNTNKLQCRRFADEKFATLLYRFLHLLKKGSSKETILASRAIGLLSVTITCEDNAHEIYEASLPQISETLKSNKTQPELLSCILDCLGIITFHGSQNCEETETSMQIIWEFIQVEGSKVIANKQAAPDVLAAAISAWSFLLTSMRSWEISFKHWQGSISYLSSLLGQGDKSVRIAACEALALILQMDCIAKFSSEAKDFLDSSVNEGAISLKGHELKDKFIEEVRDLIEKASIENMSQEPYCEEPIVQDDSSTCNPDCAFSSASEGFDHLETPSEIGESTLTRRTQPRSIQLKFFKRFLGSGFVKHMQENKLLQRVFKFSPSGNGKHLPTAGHEQHLFEREKAIGKFFLPELRHKDSTQRIHQSPNSAYNKVKSQWLKRQRMLSQAKNTGHFLLGDE